MQILDANDAELLSIARPAGQGGIDELSPRGGEEIILHGRNLGPKSADRRFDVVASYSNGAGPVLEAHCVAGERSLTLRCTTSPGVGVGYSWRVVVNDFRCSGAGDLPP